MSFGGSPSWVPSGAVLIVTPWPLDAAFCASVAIFCRTVPVIFVPGFSSTHARTPFWYKVLNGVGVLGVGLREA
jgi:hypothetical protein